MEGKILEEFKELTAIDWEEVKSWRSPKKVVEYFEKVYGRWISFCVNLEQSSESEYKQKAADLEADVRNHSDYQAMKKRVEDLEMLYAESERQRKAAQQERDKLRKELSSMKKAGRPAVEQWIIDRIEELRGQGLSVRKIQKALEAEGISVSVAVVGKYISVYNKNRQSAEVDNTDMI